MTMKTNNLFSLGLTIGERLRNIVVEYGKDELVWSDWDHALVKTRYDPNI